MTKFNVSLLLLAAAPATSFDGFCRHAAVPADGKQHTALISILPPTCETWLHRPVATVNALLIWNVCVVFWLLSLLQQSTWVRARIDRPLQAAARRSTRSDLCS